MLIIYSEQISKMDDYYMQDYLNSFCEVIKTDFEQYSVQEDSDIKQLIRKKYSLAQKLNIYKEENIGTFIYYSFLIEGLEKDKLISNLHINEDDKIEWLEKFSQSFLNK